MLAMDGGLPEIAHFLRNNPITGGTVEQIQSIAYFDEADALSSAILLGNNDLGLGELMVDRAMKSEPDIEHWCNENFGRITNYGYGINIGKTSAIARTTSCPPAPSTAAAKGKGKTVASGENRFNKKRKAENSTVVAEERPLEKKLKPDMEKDSKKTTINDQEEAPKENSKGTEVAKPDYIHVRARRGQATDSHSLAERVRREKISAKMKYLQNLVPGCNKITGKAGMLDEIINYVQSLQRQVEFLSMKLAAIAPTLNFGVDGCLTNCGYTVPAMGMSSLGQGEASTSGLDITLRRTISAPICFPSLDSSCLNATMQQIQNFGSESELQNLFDMMDLQQGMRSPAFISDQPFSGFVETGNVKLEEM